MKRQQTSQLAAQATNQAQPALEGTPSPEPRRAAPEPFLKLEEPPLRKSRISVALTDDGGFNWDAMKPATRDQFVAALKVDPNVLRAISPDVQQFGMIQPENVHQLLDMVSMVERWGIPALLKKSRGVELHPDALEAFQFSAQQKEMLGVPGAATANELLPESVRLWWLKGSNIGTFLAVFALCIQQHMQTAWAIHLAKGGKVASVEGTDKPNGAAREVPPSGAVSPSEVTA